MTYVSVRLFLFGSFFDALYTPMGWLFLQSACKNVVAIAAAIGIIKLQMDRLKEAVDEKYGNA